MRPGKFTAMFLLLNIAASLNAAEITLKYIDQNEFMLNVTEESAIKTFKLVKKNVNVPTMLVEEDGLISNVESEVGSSYVDVPDRRPSNCISQPETSFLVCNKSNGILSNSQIFNFNFSFSLMRFTMTLTAVHQ